MSEATLINLDLTLEEVMRLWPATVPVFLRHQMLCVGCMIGPFHTITDACKEYHLEQALFVEELERAVATARAD